MQARPQGGSGRCPRRARRPDGGAGRSAEAAAARAGSTAPAGRTACRNGWVSTKGTRPRPAGSRAPPPRSTSRAPYRRASSPRPARAAPRRPAAGTAPRPSPRPDQRCSSSGCRPPACGCNGRRFPRRCAQTAAPCPRDGAGCSPACRWLCRPRPPCSGCCGSRGRPRPPAPAPCGPAGCGHPSCRRPHPVRRSSRHSWSG